MAEVTCPPLGTGSIDMNALHDAAVKLEKRGKGGDLTDALEAATTVVEPTKEELAAAADLEPAAEPAPVAGHAA